jgi:prevent-host-death family protein
MKISINDLESLGDKPSPVLKQIIVTPNLGWTISVRSAKAHLSALLELVAGGREITITSGGKPKARIVSTSNLRPRKFFSGASKHLAKMPPWRGGSTADEIISEDRDSRP